MGERGGIVRANDEFGGVTGGDGCRFREIDGGRGDVDDSGAGCGRGGPFLVDGGLILIAVIERGQVVVIVDVFDVAEVEMGEAGRVLVVGILGVIVNEGRLQGCKAEAEGRQRDGGLGLEVVHDQRSSLSFWPQIKGMKEIMGACCIDSSPSHFWLSRYSGSGFCGVSSSLH